MNTYEHNNNNEGIKPVLMGKTDTTISSIPNESTWKLIRETYKRVFTDAAVLEYINTNDDNDDDDDDDDYDYYDDDADDDTWYTSDHGGFIVPYEVKHHPLIEKGRGVFSTGFIPKDGTVLDSNEHHAFFGSEAIWRQFLTLLPLDLAKDVTQWAYVVKDETDVLNEHPDPSHVVCLDMFAGSLMNHGDTTTVLHNDLLLSSSSSLSLANIYQNKSHDDYFASYDIQPGDEFLVDYKKFHIKNHKLDWFDTMRNELFTEDHGFKVLSHEHDKSDLL